MKFRRILVLFVGIVLPAAVANAADKFEGGELTDASYAKWRDHVLPRSWEFSYRRISWRPSFWEAIIEAQEKDKPVLLWAMNGHPLCNT